jgi:hypothetical protein
MPGQAFQVIPPAKVVEEAAPPAPHQPVKRAVWIVHGMGQQLPFETLDGLAEGIMRVAQPLPGRNYFEPRARTVQIGDQTVQRVELDVLAGDRQVELHLYEAYWAPDPISPPCDSRYLSYYCFLTPRLLSLPNGARSSCQRVH